MGVQCQNPVDQRTAAKVGKQLIVFLPRAPSGIILPGSKQTGSSTELSVQNPDGMQAQRSISIITLIKAKLNKANAGYITRKIQRLSATKTRVNKIDNEIKVQHLLKPFFFQHGSFTGEGKTNLT